MYERFTDRARKVMQLANQEAQRFNHEYVGTEHILLGLVKEGSGVAANVLQEPRRRPAEDPPRGREDRSGRPGHGHDGQAAPDPSSQEGHRVRHRGSPQPQPQLRRHRTPAAGPAARAGGRGRPGSDEPGSEAGRSARGGAELARSRDGRWRRKRTRCHVKRQQVQDSGPGLLRPRPDRAGPARQARPGHRPPK